MQCSQPSSQHGANDPADRDAAQVAAPVMVTPMMSGCRFQVMGRGTSARGAKLPLNLHPSGLTDPRIQVLICGWVLRDAMRGSRAGRHHPCSPTATRSRPIAIASEHRAYSSARIRRCDDCRWVCEAQMDLDFFLPECGVRSWSDEPLRRQSSR